MWGGYMQGGYMQGGYMWGGYMQGGYMPTFDLICFQMEKYAGTANSTK